MSCMYVGEKKPPKTQGTGGKPFLGITRPSELSKGIDGSLDPNLSSQFYKVTGHELENCRQLQRQLALDHLAAQTIEAQGQKPSGNANCH